MELIYLCFLHFISDFLLQSRAMGERKSENFLVLVAHVSIVHLVFMILAAPVFDFDFKALLGFATLNAIVHGVIDWNIWRVYKFYVHRRYKNFEIEHLKQHYRYWEDPWFYTTIGLDQFLHTATIIILYNMLGS